MQKLYRNNDPCSSTTLVAKSQKVWAVTVKILSTKMLISKLYSSTCTNYKSYIREGSPSSEVRDYWSNTGVEFSRL